MAENETVEAIMSSDTVARLSALIRRHGGTPQHIEPANGKPKFPPMGRRKPAPDDPTLFVEP
jgi:hypothetical protein